MADLLEAPPPPQGMPWPSVSKLAVKAKVKRWVLTHKHTDLMEHFQAEIEQRKAAAASAPRLKPRSHLEQAEQEIARLRYQNAELHDRVAFYANTLDALSLEYQALAAQQKTMTKVVPLERHRTPPG